MVMNAFSIIDIDLGVVDHLFKVDQVCWQLFVEVLEHKHNVTKTVVSNQYFLRIQ